MSHISPADPSYQRDLGNGLVLRWSTSKDIEGIIDVTGLAFPDKPEEPGNPVLALLMNELLNHQNPLTGPGDTALVEDTRKHRVVASTSLWRQQWAYEGIPFGMGRPEIVATDPEYRNRGLIRTIFELIHARSEAEGHLAQGITGIPYFYRQFGYEYAMELDWRRSIPLSSIPSATEGATEPYAFRDATLADLPLLARLYELQCAPIGVTTPFDEQWWSYQIQSELIHDDYWLIKMIVDTDGASVGYMITTRMRVRKSIPMLDLALLPGTNWQAVLPTVLRLLQALGETLPAMPDARPLSGISIAMGRTHPIHEVLGKSFGPEAELPYAWYVRVPDLPKFIRFIASALEKRLAQSPVAGYSGELYFNFYRSGLRMVFDKGLLTGAEHWKAPQWNHDHYAAFPPLVFLQLLFGHRSLDELHYAFPDVLFREDAELVLNTLFPKKAGWAVPLG